MDEKFKVIKFEPPAPPLRGLSSRLMEFYGPQYLNREAPEAEWILKKSLALGDVALLAGLPGVGKGWLSNQLAVHVAAGLDFLGWQIEHPWRTLYLTAEESPNVVHRRARAALLQLLEGLRYKAACAFHGISVCGNVGLVTTDKSGRLAATENFFDLDALFDDLSPGLVILDTFARFFPVNENDNSFITTAFSLLEQLADKYKTTVLVTHHCSKIGSIFADSESMLKSNLTLQSIRGGSAISGCVRWVVMLTPLTSRYAAKLFGDAAGEKPDGCYVAGRVVKKNEGPGEDIFYLKHGEGGLFEQVEPGCQIDDLSDAEILAREVRRREASGEEPLSAVNGAREAFRWGSSRSQKAISQALTEGLLIIKRREVGKGNILRTEKPDLLQNLKNPEKPEAGF